MLFLLLSVKEDFDIQFINITCLEKNNYNLLAISVLFCLRSKREPI
jgi:hypothetical protein